MGIRGVPPGITDPNLRGFLQDIRNALAGVSEKVTKLSTTTTTSSGGGGNPGGGGGGGNPPDGGGGGPTPPPSGQSSVVLTISPSSALINQMVTLTATVSGTAVTGNVVFLNHDNDISGSVQISSAGIATFSTSWPTQGTEILQASYSGDANNLSALSNIVTLTVGSVWNGPPSDPLSLTATSGYGFVYLDWQNLYIGDYAGTEIWGSETNNSATRVLLGNSTGAHWSHTPATGHPTWYYWIRNYDNEAAIDGRKTNYSNYYPSGSTGVKGTVLDVEGTIASSKLWGDLGTRIGTDEQNIAVTSGIVQGPTGLAAQYMVKTDVSGPGGKRLVGGFGLYNDGATLDFAVRADRFSIGTPNVYDNAKVVNDQSIPFIVYTSTQTFTNPGGQSYTIPAGVYMKAAYMQTAQINNAQIVGSISSYNFSSANKASAGWQIDKGGNIEIHGGSFSMYDPLGNPTIQLGKIEFNQFKRLILSGNAEIFTLSKTGAYTPTSITLIATAQNISGTLSLQPKTGYSGSFTSQYVASNGAATFSLNPTLMTLPVATFEATLTADGVNYFDDITIAKVAEGADGYTVFLTSEAHPIPTDSNGTALPGGYSGAASTMRIFKGIVEESYSNWSFSDSPSGVSYSASDNNRTVQVTNLGSNDSGYIDITGSLTSDSSKYFTKRFSVSKTKQGTGGKDGKYLKLTASAISVKQTGATATPGTITFSISSSGLTGTPVLQYLSAGSDSGTWNDYGSNTIWSYTNSGGYFPSNYSFMMWRAYSAADGIEDRVTITRVADGSPGLRGSRQWVISSNSGGWNDGQAQSTASVDGGPVFNDMVTETYGSNSTTKYYGPGGGWYDVGAYIGTNLLVAGSIGADKLSAGLVQGSEFIVGRNYSDALSVIRSSTYQSGHQGWRIDGSGNAEFNTVIIRDASQGIAPGILTGKNFKDYVTQTPIDDGQWHELGTYFDYYPTAKYPTAIQVVVTFSTQCPKLLRGLRIDTELPGYTSQSIIYDDYTSDVSGDLDARAISATRVATVGVNPWNFFRLHVMYRVRATGTQPFQNGRLTIFEIYQ